MAPLIAFIPLIAAGVGAAVTGIEIANMPKAPKAPTQVGNEAAQARAQQAAAVAQAQALARRRGMAATTLTSPLGAQSGTTQTATLGT